MPNTWAIELTCRHSSASNPIITPIAVSATNTGAHRQDQRHIDRARRAYQMRNG